MRRATAFCRTAAILGLSVMASSVFASGCPAGKEGASPFARMTETVGQLEVTLEALTDLGGEAINATNWKYRARSVVIARGAVIAWHSHDKRPELVMMKHGSLTIYEDNCTVGYAMEEGRVFHNGHGDSHWARNEGESAAVMYVTDIYSQDSFPVSAQTDK